KIIIAFVQPVVGSVKYAAGNNPPAARSHPIPPLRAYHDPVRQSVTSGGGGDLPRLLRLLLIPRQSVGTRERANTPNYWNVLVDPGSTSSRRARSPDPRALAPAQPGPGTPQSR